MATSTDKVYVEIIAKTNEAISGLANFAKSAVTLAAVWAAFKKVVVDSVKEYLKAEEAETRLAAAMRGTGEYTGYALERMKDMSSRLQEVTRFEDDATQSAMAMLISLGGLSTKMATNVIPSVQDFASAMGMDLASAATLVSKAIEGNVGALSRYGIKIQEGLTKEGRLAAITEELQKKFGGLAIAMGDTAGGAVARLGNAFSDMKEEIGRATITSLKPLVVWLSEVATKITSVMKASNDLRESLNNEAKGIADTNDRLVIAQGKYNELRAELDALNETLNHNYNLTAKMREEYKKQIKIISDQIVIQRRLVNAIENQAKREAEVAEAEAEKARKIAEYQERLATAYAKTEAGQRAALLKEIKFWEDSLKATKGGSAEISAILDDLKKQYEDMIPKVEEIGKTGRGGHVGRGKRWSADKELEELIKGIEESRAATADWESYWAEVNANIQEDLEKTKEQWMEIGGFITSIAETMGEAFASGDIVGGLKSIAQQLTSMLATLALEAAASAAVAQNWPMVAFWLAVAGVSAFTGGAIGGAGGGEKSGIGVPQMASGGIVTKPTLALIGEAGPEAVVPLSRAGGGDVNIIVQGSVWQTEDLARAVAGAMGRW